MDLSIYYEQISKHKSLTREEEQELFAEYYDPQTSEAKKEVIKNKIISTNLRFVFKRAKRYSKNDPEQFEELIAAGNEGLLVGFNKYDPNSGCRFLSYAGWWVLQRILKEMSKFRVVSLPIWKQQLATKILRYVESCEPRTVPLEELCNQFPKADEKDIKELYETRYLTYFLDDLSEEDGTPESITGDAYKELETNTINSSVQKLPEPHKTVIKMSYGLGNNSEWSIKDIMELLDIDRKTLNNIKKEALSKLEGELSDFSN